MRNAHLSIALREVRWNRKREVLMRREGASSRSGRELRVETPVIQDCAHLLSGSGASFKTGQETDDHSYFS